MTRALILGRFQPPHLGHLDAIEQAAKRHDEVVVVVGSAQESFTPTNPFTSGERIEMLRAAVAERGLGNVIIVPLADIHRHGEWVAYVESSVPEFHEVVTNNPLTRLLFETGGYKVTAGKMFHRDVCSATRVRKRLGKGESVDDAVSPAVRKILRRIRAERRLRELSQGDLHGERSPGA
ncbi:MAG: nicotinamide-nucleotide adenylyltransferase [Euryarchaeota archaeon]|nr:nicotinamide-nucleotide adenylyltransferase [Euryarchaeota archaeon]